MLLWKAHAEDHVPAKRVIPKSKGTGSISLQPALRHRLGRFAIKLNHARPYGCIIACPEALLSEDEAPQMGTGQ